MKKTIFFPLLFFATQLDAQEPYFKEFKQDQNGIMYFRLDTSKFPGIISKDSLGKLFKNFHKTYQSPNMGRFLSTQPNGTKIYSLPGDNMICLVPDLSRFNYNMPIAGKGMKTNGMPPGTAPPNKIIPDEK